MASQTSGEVTPSLLLRKSAVPARVLVASIVLGLVFVTTIQRRRSTEIRVINSYDWDFMGRREKAAYMKNAEGLVADGFAKGIDRRCDAGTCTDMDASAVSGTIPHHHHPGVQSYIPSSFTE